MRNYLTYPCKVMNITQGYNGSASHKPHTTGSPKDYPWDEACGNTGRSPMYCPCDEMKIKRISTAGTNTIWLESTSKVWLADGTQAYVTLMVTHPNDSDIKRLKVGQRFKRGELICYEGIDGGATGNHFHFSVGKGKVKSNGWKENSKGKWVLTCTDGTYKPEALFYIDPEFTTVKKSNGLKFKELPKVEFFPEKGYFKKGDTDENIGKIASFMRECFPAYTSRKALGNYYGNYLYAAIKEFKKRTGLTVNDKIDTKTVAMLEKHGFEKE